LFYSTIQIVYSKQNSFYENSVYRKLPVQSQKILKLLQLSQEPSIAKCQRYVDENKICEEKAFWYQSGYITVFMILCHMINEVYEYLLTVETIIVVRVCVFVNISH
jgi:hypothetical protein